MSVARLRDRPAALLLTWASVALPALVLALPIGGVSGAYFGERLDGDAFLFAPGGEPLLEAMRLVHRELVGFAVAAPWLAAAYALAAVLPWACLLVSLSAPPLPLSAIAARALSRMPTLTLLLGLGLACRAIVAAIGSSVASSLGGASANDRTATLLSVAAGGATLALLAAVRVLHDLASAAACRHGTRAPSAALHALATLAERPAALLARWAALAAGRLALVVLAGWATAHVGVSSGGRVLAVFLLHQATLFALVVLRAAWLRVATAAVGGDDPADSAARGEIAA